MLNGTESMIQEESDEDDSYSGDEGELEMLISKLNQKVMEEKEIFLNEVAEKNYVLFFEHDYLTECATVHKTEKGVVLKDKFKLEEYSSK